MSDSATLLNRALAGRYAVERELGRGGMATVYLARDLKHQRFVALKVLDPELGAVLGGERFLAEIRVTANLQHPNLLPLFDSGEAEGRLFYVMPFVEGETLRTRLDRERQLPVDEAVRIATAVAAALDYAHRHGVIHRDLKPENILLHEGEPLVADFGIALAVSNAGGGRVTQTGLSLGTPQYMSPEQATGDRVIDGRTDVYSLGAVCYEMLTGEPPHTGTTAQAVIARLLTEPPRPIRSARPSVPEHVEAAVGRALEKLPADRFATAKEFASALGAPAPREAGARVSTARGGPPEKHDTTTGTPDHHRSIAGIPLSTRAAIPWLVAAACAIAAVSLGAWAALRTPAPPRAMSARFTIDMPQGTQLDNVYAPLTITHDGRAVIFRALVNGAPQLVRRDIDGLSVTPIPGTEDARHPVVSPDDRWLAFTVGNDVRRASIAGGPAVPVGIEALQGIAWAGNDRLVVNPASGAGLRLVSTAGGNARTILSVDPKRGEVALRWPKVLADGNTVLYVSWPTLGIVGARIGVVSLATGESTVLDLPGTTPLGVADGQLFYVSPTGVLTAVPFDVRARKLTGPPRPLIEGIDVNTVVGAARVALADSGTLVYLTGGTNAQLVTLESEGPSKVLLAQGLVEAPAWSPDGGRIAVNVTSPRGKPDVGVVDLATGAYARLTGEGNNRNPTWSHDGRRIVFTSTRGAGPGIWWQPADGSGNPEKLTDTDAEDAAGVLSPDGRWLVYERGLGAARTLWALELTGARSQRTLVSVPGAQNPALSPDGKWLAYDANDAAGQDQVYVRPFPDSGAATQVSLDGGENPVWAPDGKTLYYDVRARLMFAAALAPGSTMGVTGRRQIFAGRYVVPGAGRRPPFAVSPDGKRFVMLSRATGESKVVVVTNWLAELRASQGDAARR